MLEKDLRVKGVNPYTRTVGSWQVHVTFPRYIKGLPAIAKKVKVVIE